MWLFQMLTARLMSELGIWLHPDIYTRFPILLPFAIRDPGCRKRGVGDREEWGSPNDEGYFRDDNSLVKNLPSTLKIESQDRQIYDGARIGKGFTAAHVWRLTESDEEIGLTTQHPLMYSFVPNLVWLPRQVGKLSDREGSFSQLFLQATAAKIYRDLPVSQKLKPFVDRAWSLLPEAKGLPEQGLPKLEDLSFFSPSERFLRSRVRAVRTVVGALAESSGNESTHKVISSRYGSGLRQLLPGMRSSLRGELARYLDAVTEHESYE